MKSVGIPNPSRGHIPHMFFIYSCRTPMPHSHSHVLACQPHSLAMMCEACFPRLELGLSHSDIPYMFPAEACGFPWSKIRTIIGCRSDFLTNHWGFSVLSRVYTIRDATRHDATRRDATRYDATFKYCSHYARHRRAPSRGSRGFGIRSK